MRLSLKDPTEHMCRVLNRNLWIWSCSITNIANSYNKLFWKWDIWKDDYEKSSKNLTLFFMEFAMRNKKGQELDTSLFSGKYVQKFRFMFGPSPDHLWCLNSQRFWSFFKVTIGIKYMDSISLFHNYSIFSFVLKHKTLNKKQQNVKKKKKKKKIILVEIKKSSYFLRTFLGEI